MKYNAVIFDLFGTLVPYIGKEEFKSSLYPLARIFEVDLNVIEEFWSSKEGYYKGITKYNSTYERVNEFCGSLGIKRSERVNEAVKSRLSIHENWLKPKRKTIETLQSIKASNIKIGLISNCSAEVSEIWETTSISKYIDIPIFSCIEQMNKSEIDIFKLCSNRLNTPIGEILYVGDSREELVMAKEVGMKPILIKTRKKINWEEDSIQEPIEILDYLEILN